MYGCSEVVFPSTNEPQVLRLAGLSGLQAPETYKSDAHDDEFGLEILPYSLLLSRPPISLLSIYSFVQCICTVCRPSAWRGDDSLPTPKTMPTPLQRFHARYSMPAFNDPNKKFMLLAMLTPHYQLAFHYFPSLSSLIGISSDFGLLLSQYWEKPGQRHQNTI